MKQLPERFTKASIEYIRVEENEIADIYLKKMGDDKIKFALLMLSEKDMFENDYSYDVTCDKLHFDDGVFVIWETEHKKFKDAYMDFLANSLEEDDEMNEK